MREGIIFFLLLLIGSCWSAWSGIGGDPQHSNAIISTPEAYPSVNPTPIFSTQIDWSLCRGMPLIAPFGDAVRFASKRLTNFLVPAQRRLGPDPVALYEVSRRIVNCSIGTFEIFFSVSMSAHLLNTVLTRLSYLFPHSITLNTNRFGIQHVETADSISIWSMQPTLLRAIPLGAHNRLN